MIELLALPALACTALVAIHAYFGLQVLERNAIFVDLALVAAAALGAAAALLLVDRAPQGAEHIRRILTGDILGVGWEDLRWMLPLYGAVGLVHPRLRIPNPWLSEFAFYAALGIVLTSCVALAGVLLALAFLIVPAAIGVLHGATFRSQLVIAWIAGTLTALAGLAIAYWGDFPAGATLVCTYGFALALAAVAQAFRLPQAKGSMFDVAWWLGRWLLAGLLAASAIWVVVAPRADQPLLDGLERAFPAVRTAYMDEKSRAIADDAARRAERYRVEAGTLRARQAQRRGQGEPVDEVETRRIASSLRSYGEMTRGEELAMREARERAREARRWWIGGVLGALALSLIVSLPSKRTAPQGA